MLLVSDENASVVVCMRTEMGESRACMCARACVHGCVRAKYASIPFLDNCSDGNCVL